MEIEFFATAGEFRKWFENNHEKLSEQWVGFYRTATGRPSITWPESVDAALCFGWIDGVRKSIDGESYKIRFTPRKKKSIWSAVNIRRMKELDELGLLHPNGKAAFVNRDERLAQLYSHEQETVEFPAEFQQEFEKHSTAWEFFNKQPPSYRKMITWWVIKAKQEPTRQKRLKTLIETSGELKRIT